MNARQKPFFPRVRFLMMLFMLVSMVASVGIDASAAPGARDGQARSPFQTAEQCYALDTNEDLNLSEAELSAITDPVERETIRDYCAALPSQVLSVDDGEKITICHATGSESNPYVKQTVSIESLEPGVGNDNGQGPHHLHQDGRDIIPAHYYNDALHSAQGDQSWLANDCKFADPEPETGTVIVEKYYCADEDLFDDEGIGSPVIGLPSEYENCVAGDAIVDLLDGEDESVLSETDDLFAGVTLPFGTYYLVEWFDGEWVEMATITLDAENTEAALTIINPDEGDEEPTVDLDIYKSVCKDVDEDAETDPCIPSDAMDGHTLYFDVYAFDGTAEDDELTIVDAVETSMVIEGNLGSAALTGLPVADFYAVCEIVPEGIETVYVYSEPMGELYEDDEIGACVIISGDDVAESGLIEVFFWNDLDDETPPVKPETPTKPETPAKPEVVVPQQPAPTVTTLPSTGSGTADADLAPWMLMASAVVLAGTGALLRRERMAA